MVASRGRNIIRDYSYSRCGVTCVGERMWYLQPSKGLERLECARRQRLQTVFIKITGFDRAEEEGAGRATAVMPKDPSPTGTPASLTASRFQNSKKLCGNRATKGRRRYLLVVVAASPFPPPGRPCTTIPGCGFCFLREREGSFRHHCTTSPSKLDYLFDLCWRTSVSVPIFKAAQ